MSLQVILPPNVVAALKQLMKLDNDAEAVERVTGEYLRLSRLRELKTVSGRGGIRGELAETRST